MSESAAKAAEPTPIDLTGGVRTSLEQAWAKDRSPALSYVDLDGRPVVTFRGSLMVIERDVLALWARGSKLQAAIEQRPDVSIVYWNPDFIGAFYFEIYGRARLAPQESDRVWTEMPEGERLRDLERKGCAVAIDVDRVVGSIYDKQPESWSEDGIPSEWARPFEQVRT